jgi:hypothetical protein
MGAVVQFTFNGWTGQGVTAFLNNRGPGSLSLRLSKDGVSLDYDGFSSADRQVSATLPEDGIYILTVDGQGDDTPGYTLCLPNPTGIDASRFEELGLYQNHPNPFNPLTTIPFTLPTRSETRFTIYDVEGRLVATLVDDMLEGGFKEVVWNGTDAHGNPVSSGVYFCRLKAAGKVLTKKMVLLK